MCTCMYLILYLYMTVPMYKLVIIYTRPMCELHKVQKSVHMLVLGLLSSVPKHHSYYINLSSSVLTKVNFNTLLLKQ